MAQSQATHCGIYVGQIGSWTVISPNNLGLPYYYSTNDLYQLINCRRNLVLTTESVVRCRRTETEGKVI